MALDLVDVYRILDGTKAGDDEGNRGEKIRFQDLKPGDLFTSFHPRHTEGYPYNDGKGVWIAESDPVPVPVPGEVETNWAVHCTQVFPPPAGDVIDEEKVGQSFGRPVGVNIGPWHKFPDGNMERSIKHLH